MFAEGGPECWMHRQAGWIPDFWPEGTAPGVDSSFFYLPPIDPEFGSPVLGGGDIYAGFSDRPEVLALMEYLASPEGAEVWVKAGGFISPNSAVPADWYGSYVDQAQAEILANATTLRFDASDLMPAEVGAGTFWTGSRLLKIAGQSSFEKITTSDILKEAKVTLGLLLPDFIQLYFTWIRYVPINSFTP
jgi:alpha-glucoside transport system substrate-binding protein